MENKHDTYYLLKASQGGTVRIIPATQEHISGVYTDNLKTCVAVVILGEKNKKPCISLSHVDAVIDLKSLEEEFVFIGNFSEIKQFIIAHKENNSDAKELAEKIDKFFKEKEIPVKIEIVSIEDSGFGITINGDYLNESKTKHSHFLTPDDLDHRHATNMLNRSSDEDTSKNRNLDIQYDGENWTGSPKLSDWLQGFINKITEGKRYETFSGIKSSLKTYCHQVVKNYIKGGNLPIDTNVEEKANTLACHLANYIFDYLNIVPYRADFKGKSCVLVFPNEKENFITFGIPFWEAEIYSNGSIFYRLIFNFSAKEKRNFFIKQNWAESPLDNGEDKIRDMFNFLPNRNLYEKEIIYSLGRGNVKKGNRLVNNKFVNLDVKIQSNDKITVGNELKSKYRISLDIHIHDNNQYETRECSEANQYKIIEECSAMIPKKRGQLKGLMEFAEEILINHPRFEASAKYPTCLLELTNSSSESDEDSLTRKDNTMQQHLHNKLGGDWYRSNTGYRGFFADKEQLQGGKATLLMELQRWGIEPKKVSEKKVSISSKSSAKLFN